MALPTKGLGYSGLSHNLRPLRMRDLKPFSLGYAAPFENIEFRCEGCKKVFKVDMDQQLPEEAGYRKISETVFMVMQQALVCCPRCGFQNLLPFPKPEGEPSFSRMFGDEAMIDVKETSEFIYLFALVDIGIQPNPELIKALHQAKLAIWPNKQPETWHLHIKDIRNKDWRKKHEISTTIEDINSIISGLIDAVRINQENRRLHVAIGSGHISKALDARRKKLTKDYIRNILFSKLMRAITYYYTKDAISVEIVMEAINKEKDNRMDNYIEVVGRSLRTELKYMYSTHGVYVGLPHTVQKGDYSNPGLEYADLLAFYVRRYLEDHIRSRKPHVKPERFGEIQWLVISGMRIRSKISPFFDWEYFYGDHRSK